jgi:RNA polymerase sigma factor (sigma-70 family)
MERVSNNEVMERFKKIDELSNEDQVRKIHNQIVEDLSFLVYSNTKKYRKFSNYEDLNQEGFVGLIKATKRFNHRLFPNFFVFANQWIINGIMRSAKKHDVVYNPKRIKTVYCDNDDMPMVDEGIGPDECFCNQEKIEGVHKAIETLTDRDKKIIKNIYGIGAAEHTLRGTEKFCNLTYERIRQIKNKAIEKLKLNKNLIEIE